LNELHAREKVNLVTKGKDAQDGSKSGGEVVGSLLATLATSAGGALILSLTNALQSWLTHHKKRKIILEIGGNKLEVTGIPELNNSTIAMRILNNIFI
jgi:hypothetical protein